jgi:hypothetical protein
MRVETFERREFADAVQSALQGRLGILDHAGAALELVNRESGE